MGFLLFRFKHSICFFFIKIEHFRVSFNGASSLQSPNTLLSKTLFLNPNPWSCLVLASMAEDVAFQSDAPKSCCEALKSKLLKKEEQRIALRKAISLLENRINELESENSNLKKECEQEQMRALREREAKVKESGSRIELEKEICNLKVEITSLQKRGCLEGQEEEVVLLRTRLLEGEAELKRLKELLENERRSGDAERKKVEAEKKKTTEARKLVKAEKSKTEEQRKLAEIERKRAEEFRILSEASKLEANEVNNKLIMEKSKLKEANKKAEAEKQRANREKKRADSEVVKAAEYRKCAEVEKQNTKNEKSRADHLSQQLEKERLMKERLQKEIQEITAVGNANKQCSSHGARKCSVTPPADRMVSNQQLKMEKMQAKHDKRIAKQEKLQNNLLRQELDLLKLDAIQLSRRLNMIDGCFSHGMEGIDGFAKIGNCLSRQRINPNSGVSDAFDNFKAKEECMGTLFPSTGVSCPGPISGTNSELESLIGGSFRSKSPNFDVSSTSTCISDRQLMGSQERGTFPSTASARFVEESSKQGSHVKKLSAEVTKKRHGEHVGVVDDNDDGAHLTPYVTSNIVGKVPRHSRKRKRIQDTLDSILSLHSVDKKLHMKVEEMISLLRDILGLENKVLPNNCSQIDGNSSLSGNGKCVVSKILAESHYKRCNSGKKRKVAQKHKLSESCEYSKEQRQIDHLDIEGNRNVLFCTEPVTNCIRESVHVSKDGKLDSCKSGGADTTCLEDICGGNYMKLLELDDVADEERYRIAMEMPCSPTLPEISFTNCIEPQVDDLHYLVEEEQSRGLISDVRNLAPNDNFGVVDVEIDSSKYDLLHAKEHLTGTFVSIEQMSAAKSLRSMECTDHARSLPYLRQFNSSFVQDVRQEPIQSQSLATNTVNNVGNEITQRNTAGCCVLFSKKKDENSISRILHTIESYSSQISVAYQKHWVGTEVLLALAAEQYLQLEDQACIFLSLLLQNLLVVTRVNPKSRKAGDYLFWSDSLAIEISRVMSNVKTRSLFLEFCKCNLLFSLIEDFLIDRSVLVYLDISCKPLLPSESGSKIVLLAGRKIMISSRSATSDQLEAGAVLLSSLCRETDSLSFVCEASYNILRMCKDDLSWILTVLHIFALVCGKKYFAQNSHSLIMTTVKSVVVLLEGRRELVGIQPRFSPCVNCPFAEDAVCMDNIILMLLEKLQDYAGSGIRHQHLRKPVTSSVDAVQVHRIDKIWPENRNDMGSQLMEFSTSGSLSMDKMADASEADCVANLDSSFFLDTVSLVELISYYMDWDWMFDKIILQLLKLLESPVSEEVLAPIFILIAEMGRLGVDTGGYDQKGIFALRCSISAFLDSKTARPSGLPSQFAAAKALVDLLPFEFDELIQKNLELLVDSNQYGHAEVVKKWFSQLSEEQQALSLSIFLSAK